MGLNRVRVDSVAKLQKKKTMEELQEENEALKPRCLLWKPTIDIPRWRCATCTNSSSRSHPPQIRRHNHGRSLCNLIRRGRKTIEQVPEHLREEVKAILAADGNA